MRSLSYHTLHIANQLPSVLHHWTEAINAPLWSENGYQRNGIYLTTATDPVRDWNPDIPDLLNPLRVSIDTTHLDPKLFGYDDESHEGYPGDPLYNLNASGNTYYKGPIPRSAVREMKKFKPLPEWNTGLLNPAALGYSEWGFPD
jgi:hypothetical protein